MTRQHWATPKSLFEQLDKEWRFTLDPCPLVYSVDGLSMDWNGHRVFLNPPYNNIKPWLDKAYISDCLCVALLPARTGTEWFHEYYNKVETVFLRGRLKYGEAKDNAPFNSLLMVFK